jgi:hypothetical protein
VTVTERMRDPAGRNLESSEKVDNAHGACSRACGERPVLNAAAKGAAFAAVPGSTSSRRR